MIVFDKVNHSYNQGHLSLSDFSAVFGDGVWTALFGDNGAGKSTVALLADGLIRPTSGMVRIDGLDTRDPRSIPAVRQKIGLVFQNPDSQFVAATVEREIAFGLENTGVCVDEMRGRVKRVMDGFGMENIRDVSPRDLSQGEKALVALASILVMEPSFLILDEPTSHLDSGESERLWSLLEGMDPKPPLLLITQKRGEIAKCKRAVALASGSKTFDGTGRELLATIPGSSGWEELAEELLAQGLPVKGKLVDPVGLVESVLLCRGMSSAEGLSRSGPAVDRCQTWIESLSLVGAGYAYRRGLPGERTALRDTNLHIERGEFLGITGPNGSGKTTISLVLAGLLPPEPGRLMVNGRNVRGSSRDRGLRRELGFVFQNPERAFFTERCLDEVTFGPRNFRLSDPEERARRALDQVGLDPKVFAARSPFQISYGEQRRLAMACALAYEPAVVFCDEPTAGLDAQGRSLVAKTLSSMKLSGKTVILVSHDLGLLLDLCDRIIAMDGGRIVYDGSPEGLVRSGSPVPLTPELESIQDVLLQLEAAGLPVAKAVPSPRRAARAIIEALAQ